MTSASYAPDARGIAIIGMGCMFAGAPDVDSYWRNILGKVDATSDPPPEAWDPEVYYDPQFADEDRTYCKRGGYLGALARFDPLAHGIPPVAVGGEPDQWLALHVVREALADAGSSELPDEVRARTAVILGKGTYLNGGNAVAVQRGLVIGQTLELIRRLDPHRSEEELEELRRELQRGLPPLGPETVPGLIPNIIVGRIANRLDLMGPAYTVDAACASSLLAVQHAMRDLLAQDCDLAIAGGSQVWMPVATMNLFCRLGALSRRERLRAFDAQADGTLLGEGIGALVLKRAQDAIHDGDRVYAVIRGIGVASDGRGMSVMAPRVDGEELALRRAYEAAGVSPASIGMVEAHGTGTPVGDAVEVEALTRVFGEREEELPRCAIGTVKSMIGHTIPAAGVAGLIKAALSLHNRVLPPTIGCEQPNPKLELERTPFYINADTRPWIHGGAAPRRAGVNAFGFGGINAHAVLEEWGGPAGVDHTPPWDGEVFILERDTPQALADAALELVDALAREPEVSPADLAFTLAHALGGVAQPRRLAVVASSLQELREKLEQAARRLADPACRRIKATSGIYYESQPLGREAKVAFVYPGEGAQYPNMLAELCLHFPQVRAVFDRIDRLYAGHPRGHVLSDWVFPRAAFSERERQRTQDRLMELDVAVEAVLTANAAAHELIRPLLGRCDAMVGHSTGEHSAAMAAGALDVETDERLALFCHGLYASYADAAERHEVPAAMLLAIGADAEQARRIAAEAGGELHLAMDNCPHQAVLVGAAEAVARARELAVGAGLMCEQLPYDRAVHTPLFAPFADELRETFARLPVRRARASELWSCTTAARYPDEPAAIRELLVEHWTRPVRFRETVEALYDDGVRVFVEVGPRGNMTAFVEDILRGRAVCAAAADVPRRSGTLQLSHLVGMLAVHDAALDLGCLFEHRCAELVDMRALAQRSPGAGHEVPLSTTWPMLKLSDAALERLAAPAPAPVARDRADDGHPAPLHEVGAELEGDLAGALDGYLDTMESFLQTSAEVMRAYLPGATSAVGEDPARPLLGTVLACEPEQELVAQRVVDPREDRYLLHHTLGGAVSRSDPDLHALALMPLAMSVELLAQAAAALLPGRVVTGLRDVCAHRWLAFGESAQTLELSARRLADAGECARVHVELRNLDENDDPAALVVEATVQLEDEFPPAPSASLAVPPDARASRWRPEELYGEAMFHGPLWQGVASVDEVAREGARAQLEVPARAGFLRSLTDPSFVLDPVLLDAAGQVVGFWAADVLERDSVVFPFRLAALDVYGATAPEGERLACTTRTRLEGDRLVCSDVEVVDAGGRCLMRLEGWTDKRFEVPERFAPLTSPRALSPVSRRWQLPAASHEDLRVACRRLDSRLAADVPLWKRVWAGRVLGRRERELFASLPFPEARQLEWLAGRTAAKECVAELLREAYGLDLMLADIEVLPDDRGAPVVLAEGLEELPQRVAISIAHAGGCAAALAALVARDGEEGVGIDLEPIVPRPHLARAALDEGELRLLESVEQGVAEEWQLRLWCAKEAAGKALGEGLAASAGLPRARSIDLSTQAVLVDVSGSELLVQTRREADVVVATTVRRSPSRSARVLEPA